MMQIRSFGYNVLEKLAIVKSIEKAGARGGMDTVQDEAGAGKDKPVVPVKPTETTGKKSGKQDLPESTGTMKRLLEHFARAIKSTSSVTSGSMTNFATAVLF